MPLIDKFSILLDKLKKLPGGFRNGGGKAVSSSGKNEIPTGRTYWMRWLITGGLIVLSALLLTVISLYYAADNMGGDIFASYFYNPLIFIMNYLPVLLMMLTFTFLTRRAWIGYLLTALPVYGLALGNYFKITLRDDPLLMTDLGLLSEAGDMAGKYSVSFSGGMIGFALLLLLNAAVLAFLGKGRTRRIWAGFLGAVLFGAAGCGFSSALIINPDAYAAVVNSSGDYSPLDAAELYQSKGVVYPFINSIGAAFPHKPDGYSAAAAEEILGRYETEDIPEDKKVNIIGIQLEAFNDFSKFESIDFVKDPYDIYKGILEESYSGKLITNIFAGGTVDTERCFLTGYVEYGSLDRETPTYVRYLNDQGYYCWGAHPGYSWFYDRNTVNASMGFEKYMFYEDRYEAKQFRGESEIAQDAGFLPDIYNVYRDFLKGHGDDYTFSFNVTYQNHGPYYDFMLGSTEEYVSKEYSDASYAIANNYFTGIRNTSVQLRNLINNLENDPEPVVLVFFGDHNPWMGDDKSVYNEFGINLDTSTEEGYLNTYETDYVIWANTAAKEKLGNDFVGKGPDVGSNFLMNVLFEQLGWGGNDYMKFTDTVMKVSPLMAKNSYYLTEDGLVGSLPEKDAAKMNEYRIVQYYEKYDAAVHALRTFGYEPPSPKKTAACWVDYGGLTLKQMEEQQRLLEEQAERQKAEQEEETEEESGDEQQAEQESRGEESPAQAPRHEGQASGGRGGAEHTAKPEPAHSHEGGTSPAPEPAPVPETPAGGGSEGIHGEEPSPEDESGTVI